MEKPMDEVIRKTVEYICNRAHPGLSPPCIHCAETAEYLHEHILAPLFEREFPEDEIRSMLFDFAISFGDAGLRVRSIEKQAGIVNDFKRLWHSQEAPMEPEPLIDHRPFKEAKGGCPRCGGGGEIHDSAGSSGEYPGSLPYWKPCPACAGTGERRKGEQRKGLEERAWLFFENEPTKGIHRDFHQKRWFFDDRSGEERRQADSLQPAPSARSGA